MQSYQFMFWNINLRTNKGDDFNKRHDNIHKAISTINDKHKIDFIMLAESQHLNSESMLNTLNIHKKKYYLGIAEKNLSAIKKRFLIFQTIDNESVTIQRPDKTKRILNTVYNLNGSNILISLVHLRDKYNYKDKALDAFAINHAERFGKFEDKYSINKSLMVGDFNLNPYQDGMINANAFNAVMSPKIVDNENRKWDGDEYKYFYNPSWSVLGKLENENHVMGTYYYDNTKDPDLAYWYMLDQLILRKDLINSYKPSSLKIISEVENEGEVIKLINEEGIPNKGEYSDHLPIIFTMEF